MDDLEGLKLRFEQKINLLKDQSPAAFVKAGIKNVNKIRNNFSHTLNSNIEWGSISNVTDILKIARRGIDYPEPIDAIEAFAPVACAFLINAPSIQRLHLENLLKDGKIKFATGVFI